MQYANVAGEAAVWKEQQGAKYAYPQQSKYAYPQQCCELSQPRVTRKLENQIVGTEIRNGELALEKRQNVGKRPVECPQIDPPRGFFRSLFR